MQIQLSHHSLLFLCLHVGVPVEVPEEPFNKLLLRQADGGDLLCSLLIALRPIEGLQVLKKLGLCADTSLGPVSALEEDHLASEHPGDGPPVEGGCRPALGELVTVLIGSSNLLSPFRVRDCAALNVPGESSLRLLSSQGCCVPVRVDLHVLSQLATLLEDAGQVAHGVPFVVFVVVDLLEELIEVILVHINQTLAGIPLCPPQGLKV